MNVELTLPADEGSTVPVTGRPIRSDRSFELVAPFAPAGDQPQAIDVLTDAIRAGERRVMLRGATGTGKTFTVANLLCALQRPALLIAPNKTLAAQLTAELRSFLPHNAVELFVSYYDFYQPEAYLPSSDTFIDKEATINEEIDRFRHRATVAALTRRDVVVVASVSCIYGLGDPDQYGAHLLQVSVGEQLGRDMLLRTLVGIGYVRNDVALTPGTFRARGDVVDLADETGTVLRIEFDFDRIARLSRLDLVAGKVLERPSRALIAPRSHYVSDRDTLTAATVRIEQEMEERLELLRKAGATLEAHRLEVRTRHDLESLRELGFCRGVENYSAHFDDRSPGQPPKTLCDYFDDDWICIVDESHVTLPQLRAMYAGDRSRKGTLIEHGFRLPSAADNRPLTFDEFTGRVDQMVCLSATPGQDELAASSTVAEQLIRPTGVVDPVVEVRSSYGQIDDLVVVAGQCVAEGHRVLVTALTKKLAETVADVLVERGVRARYLHSDLDTFERTRLLAELRAGRFDLLVGVNLLREGLDLPEVALVAVLDADREGFLRSETALVQTIGRAARNVSGRVILYAERVTPAMQAAMSETARRRQLQLQHNEDHGVVPRSAASGRAGELHPHKVQTVSDVDALPEDPPTVEAAMKAAAADLDFERAALLRDHLDRLRRR